MIYINLGFPKTSTTNLQTNFFPNLNDISYLGRNYKEKNSELFIELNNFIENRKKFSNTDFENLIQNFKNYYNDNKKILISQENWICPYQKNNLTNKIEIVDQVEKLKNLLFILDKIKFPYKFFFIHRDLNQSILSFFVTNQDKIRLLFGEKFLLFDYFLDHVYKKKSGYKDLLLLLDTYNLKKITKIIPKDKIQLFYHKDILNNKEKFINDLSNYLEIEIDNNLINKLSIFTYVTPRSKNDSYTFEAKNALFVFLKFLIPNFLFKKLKFLSKIKFIRFFLFKKIELKKEYGILRKIINE